MTAYDEVRACYESIKAKIPFRPKLALVLGNSLDGFNEQIDIVSEIFYDEIDGMSTVTATAYKGRFAFAYIDGLPVVIMFGRLHYYEEGDMQKVIFPVRLMRLMGVEILFLTNAAGGINLSYKVGDFMQICDHISFLVPSPLNGPNDERFGTRFPDMSEIYNKNLGQAIQKAAQQENIKIHTGVYLQTAGPRYETPAEIKAARIWGADAVGMSTACEAQCASHLGMKICGISCISNMAPGIENVKMSDDDVNKEMSRVGEKFYKLILASIKNISGLL